MTGIDWPGLLRWSLSYSDGTSDTPHMSKQDMIFLEAAIKDVLKNVENPSDVVKEAVDKINNNNDTETVLTALSLIERCMDDSPQISRDIGKLGALEPLLRCSERDDSITAEAALQILSLALSNNPGVQTQLCVLDGLKKLSHIVLKSSENPTLRIKALTALSALLRHNESSEKAFILDGGIGLLSLIMSSSHYKACEKAASLCRHLLVEGRVSIEEVEKHQLVERLEVLLSNRDVCITGVQYGEVVGACVIELIKQHRPKLAKNISLDKLRIASLSRLEYLKSEQKNNTFDDLQTEIDVLEEIKKICSKNEENTSRLNKKKQKSKNLKKKMNSTPTILPSTNTTDHFYNKNMSITTTNNSINIDDDKTNKVLLLSQDNIKYYEKQKKNYQPQMMESNWSIIINFFYNNIYHHLISLFRSSTSIVKKTSLLKQSGSINSNSINESSITTTITTNTTLMILTIVVLLLFMIILVYTPRLF